VDANGMNAVARHLDGLDSLARERVGAEMIKLLAAPDPAPSVAAMRHAGVLARVLPGSNDAALAPLVHLETAHGAGPSPLRRLAALGGQDAAARLRLSKSDSKRLSLLRDAAGDPDGPAALGYRYGAEAGLDILLLRAAILHIPIPEDAPAALARGAGAVFPVSAADLMPGLTGAALGTRLAALEERWIASEFTLDRADLLDE
jgi:poly(A) polymerase